MILLLRHLTLLLWLSTILGLAPAFWILPLVNDFFPGHDLSVATAAMVIAFGLTEFAMNLAGEKLVLAALRSAESWDRSGIARRSEQRYLKAMERYSLGLISPLRTKTTARALLASLAKFSLTASPPRTGFEKAVNAFLRMAPGDEEIARLWLKQQCRKNNLTRQTQETMTRIAEAHPDHPEIMTLCARLFLVSGRTDYTARKVYRAIQAGHPPDLETLAGIKALLKSEILPHPGLAAVETALPPGPFSKSNVNLAGMAEAIARRSKGLAAGLTVIFQKSAAALKAGGAFFRGQERLARVLKWGMALAGVAVIAGFGISTLFHIVQISPKKTKVEVNRVEVEIPMRFTIQVAAYLKRNHADEYVAKLKQKGLDAYIYKADGGGRTWFIVRISRFSDRESAAQYGEKLKQQHLIDDFFVDNNE